MMLLVGCAWCVVLVDDDGDVDVMVIFSFFATRPCLGQWILGEMPAQMRGSGAQHRQIHETSRVSANMVHMHQKGAYTRKRQKGA